MNTSKQMSYIERQIEMQKAQMLSAVMTDSDESDAEDPPQKKLKAEIESDVKPEPVEESAGPSGATLEMILREVQVVLGQVKKLSDTVKANEKAHAKEMQKLKADVKSIKDKVVQTKNVEIDWPISDPEKFNKCEFKIREDPIYAERMALNFKLPGGERKLNKLFSMEILNRFSEAGRDCRTPIRDSPFLNLIANSWAALDGKSYPDTITEMDHTLHKYRKAEFQKRRRQMKGAKPKVEVEERSDDHEYIVEYM